MDHHEVGKLWDENAEVWTRYSRQGCDLYRDEINTPAFMAMLPEVAGLAGIDIGCGEGHNTRLLARQGARMRAIDISARFIAHAKESERQDPLGIEYCRASAVELPYADGSFDFASGFMSFMDIPEQDRVVREAYRVLRPGGFLQFSISHPCFATLQWKWILDEQGRRTALACGDYFTGARGEIEEWIFSRIPAEEREALPKFRIPRFTHTLSCWLNRLLDAGFVLERFDEPHASDDTLARHPDLADTRIVAYFLVVRCRKT
jgi:ubiquinone/menaquinone biosynthesis C-methylase UbiE